MSLMTDRTLYSKQVNDLKCQFPDTFRNCFKTLAKHVISVINLAFLMPDLAFLFSIEIFEKHLALFLVLFDWKFGI